MAEVNLWSGLRQFTDGELVVNVKADTVGKMLDELISIYPNLEPIIEAGVSVAVDGGNGSRSKPHRNQARK